MAAKNEPEESPSSPASGDGVYIDASALAKIYLPEPESALVDEFFRKRQDLMISELTVTEVISAVARRRRERALNVRQANQVRDAVLADMRAGSFHRLDMSPAIHRHAERMLLATDSVPLRTLDALHIALALSAEAKELLTFDVRMADAAALHGLHIVQLKES